MRRRFEQAAAQRVGDRDVARPDGLDQAGHAEERVAAEFQRVAVVVVDPAEDDVDPLQAAEQSSGRPGCRGPSGRSPSTSV